MTTGTPAGDRPVLVMADTPDRSHNEAPPNAKGGGLLALATSGTLRQSIGILGAAIVVGWILVAIFAPLLAPHEPNVQQAGVQLLPIGSNGHILGTDELGRDLMSRLIYGARVSIGVGLVAVAVGSTVGAALGMIAGYFGGIIDTLVMRASDITLAYPGILLGVVIVAVLGQGTPQVAISIAIINVPIFARLARSSVLRERELDYVAAARLGGCSWWRILFRHILPNSLGPLLGRARRAHRVITVVPRPGRAATYRVLGFNAQREPRLPEPERELRNLSRPRACHAAARPQLPCGRDTQRPRPNERKALGHDRRHLFSLRPPRRDQRSVRPQRA